jgi:hypothetical protein
MWLLGASLSPLAPARKRIKRPNPQRLGLGRFFVGRCVADIFWQCGKPRVETGCTCAERGSGRPRTCQRANGTTTESSILNFAQAALQFEVSGVGGAVTGPGGAPSEPFGTSDRAIKGVIRSTARSWAVG